MSAACLFQWGAVAGEGLLFFVAVLLVWRRVAGALVEPLGLPVMLLVAVVLVATATAVRLLIPVGRMGQRRCATACPTRSHELPGDTKGKQCVSKSMPDATLNTACPSTGSLAAMPNEGKQWHTRTISVSAAVVLVALTLSLPGTSLGSLVVLWLLVALEEAWAWHAMIVSPRSPLPEPGQVELKSTPHALAEGSSSLDLGDEIPDEDVTQQFTRSRTPDGSETLAGWLRVALAPRQRTASVHVAFCPPFVQTPELAIEQLDGPEARIKVVQVLPYGARCDLKLTSAVDEPSTVLLQVSAHASAGSPIEGHEV